MKIRILADSHDNLPAVAKAVAAFNDVEVDLVIHAGDIVAPFVSIPLKELQMDFIAVYGNNDGERFGLYHTLKQKIHEPPHLLHFADRKILIQHEPYQLEALAASGHFDAIIYGHTHEIDVRKGKTNIINPGENGGWVHGKRTIAIWDLMTNDIDIIPV